MIAFLCLVFVPIAFLAGIWFRPRLEDWGRQRRARMYATRREWS